MDKDEKIAWYVIAGFCLVIVAIEVLLSVARALEIGAPAGVTYMAQLLGYDLISFIVICVVAGIVLKVRK